MMSTKNEACLPIASLHTDSLELNHDHHQHQSMESCPYNYISMHEGELVNSQYHYQFLFNKLNGLFVDVRVNSVSNIDVLNTALKKVHVTGDLAFIIAKMKQYRQIIRELYLYAVFVGKEDAATKMESDEIVFDIILFGKFH